MKTEQIILNEYQQYHHKPPGLIQLIWRNRVRYLLMILVAFLAMTLLSTLNRFDLALFIAGLLLGALLRDVATFKRFTMTWPIAESVLDWKEIERRLDHGNPR